MKLSPNPFATESYPERGVLYVRTDDGGLIRFNVGVGIVMFDAEDKLQFTFTGCNTGPMKVVKYPQEN